MITSSAALALSKILSNPLAALAASNAASADLAVLNANLDSPPKPGIKANAANPKLIPKFFAISVPLDPLFKSAANCNPVPTNPDPTPTAPPAKLPKSAAVAPASNQSDVPHLLPRVGAVTFCLG